MPRPGKFIFLLAILCAVAAAYVAPRFLKSGSAPESPVVARVFDREITRSQLDRAISEHLWLEAKSAESLTADEQKSARAAALDQLIDHELLRQKIDETEQPPLVTLEEVNERIRRFAARFESKGALETAMKSQGIPTEAALQERISAQIQQEKFLETVIAPQIKVTDEEAQQWLQQHGTTISNPERLEARHIFIPTLDQSPDEAKQKLDAALTELKENKKDFATLAKELSQDPATKDYGGALGWMTRDRLPADFAAPLFTLEPNKPTLVRTRLGWHLVEITTLQSASAATFEQARPEILSALESTKRRAAIAAYRKSLRQSAPAAVEVLGN